MFFWDKNELEKSDAALPGSMALRRLLSEQFDPLYSVSRTSRRAIATRKRQVANGWSKQERVDRLRAGLACQTWLLDFLKHT